MDIAERLATALADRYSIERLLGRGGMARVFLAQDLKHDRRVAIKVLHPEIAESLGPERFLVEIQTIARLQHPHIVPLFDSGQADGLLYYVMPYVEGETLRERLNREKQLTLDDALQITREATDALSYAHGEDVIHRDIKPENILLSGGHALVSDFGISRAVAIAGGEMLTGSGVAIGTPAYMSPEQGTPPFNVDARSDVYALGCVLYEMLVGEPPFTGPTVQAIIARHATETPPSVRVVRPGVPLSIEQVIEKSLEKSPADRFSSATHMQTALATASRKSRATQLLRSRRRWIFGTGAAVVALAVISVFAATQLRPEAPLELDLYVVTPFGHRPGAAPALLNGDMCEFHLSRAFEEFSPSIRTVGKWRVEEQRRAAGVTDPMHKDWLRIARGLHGGNLVEGEVAQHGDTVLLQAVLYETRKRGKQRNSARASFVLGVDDLDAVFEQLAADLLGIPMGPSGKPTTRDLRAAEAFHHGRMAYEEWDLVSAERGFREAVTRDPHFADAHLWLAQTLLWQGRSEWRQAAVGAHRLRDRLTKRDQLRVAALNALAERQFPQACEQYETLIAQDSGDVLAWVGLGDCHRLDDAVLPDTLSPSGWRFRTSYNSAVSAYRSALELLPSFGRVFAGRAYAPLFQVLTVRGTQVRFGRAVAADTGGFLAAHVELEADTLAYVPYRQDMVAHRQPPASTNQAVTRNRRIFADMALRWVATLPQSSQAHSARGLALELLGQIDSTRYGDSSAFAEVRRARQVARDPEEELGPAIAEVRLLIKSQQLVRARVLAESLLAQWPDPDPFQAHELVGLAALTGKVYRAGELAERSAPMFRESPGQLADVPLPVLEARERLGAYAALGAPVESLPILAARTDTRLNAQVGTPPAALRHELLDIPMVLAFPWIGVSDIHRPAARDLLIQFQWALVRGDSAGLRQRLDSLRVADRALLRGEVALWAVYGEAWLMLQLGDTTAAVEHLESSISPAVIHTLRPSFITSPRDAAAFVRSMALRAEVAAASGEAVVASQWARRVVALWDGAEADLRPLVEVMRRLQGPAEQ